MIIENAKVINAVPNRVWQITQDIERWPEWTPTVNQLTRLDEGPLRVGSVARIKQPGLPECEWRVTALTDGTSFTWTSRVYGITMKATHEVLAIESGTKSVLRLQMHGTLVTFLRPLISVAVSKSLERENTALKARCEAS